VLLGSTAQPPGSPNAMPAGYAPAAGAADGPATPGAPGSAAAPAKDEKKGPPPKKEIVRGYLIYCLLLFLYLLDTMHDCLG
jgi:hypothetical protein